MGVPVLMRSRKVARARRSSLLALSAAAAAVLLAAAGTGFVAPRASYSQVSSRDATRVARKNGENLFDRFTRVVKSNVNQVIQGMEDPEKVLDQAVDEMQQDLIKVRQSYAEVLATQRRTMSQKEQEDKVAAEWYRRAELAVEKGDDELAKEALNRRQAGVDKAAGLQSQIESMTASVEKLFDSVKMLEDKITEAKGEKEQLIARSRTAKTTAKVNEMLSDVGSTSAASAFDRMKEKVEMLETKAEVSQGMLPGGATGQSVEEKFKALESGSAVDDELAALKGKKALPQSSAVDDELEAMRKKLKDSKD